MPRARADLARRTVTVETGRRSIDLPVDCAGHLRRYASLDQRAVERSDNDSDPIGFNGHAAMFNSRSWIGGKRYGFWEEIAPGAFTKTLGEADVRFLQNHDPNFVLARNTAGTLRLEEDDKGLAVDADMAPTSYARDLAVLLERGDVSQMSFAFDMVTYEWTELDDGTELLRHLEVGLWDVSAVTYPAYDDTDASLRFDLLGAARRAGFDAIDIDGLAKRLADPDPDLLTALRSLGRGETLRPAETTGTPSGPPTSTRDDSPPAETTGTDSTHLALRHLATAHSLQEG